MAAAAIGTPALAGSLDGAWQVKVMAIGVLQDGKIVDVRNNSLGLPRQTSGKIVIEMEKSPIKQAEGAAPNEGEALESRRLA
jgi:hypothetical protein